MALRLRRSMIVAFAVFVLVCTACSSGGSKHSTATTAPGAGSTASTTPATGSTGTTAAACTTATTTGGSSGKGDTAPPGDIPDTQAFVDYTPASGGYSVKVPEGWARTDASDGATFADKYNSIGVQLTPAPAAPTADTARTTEVAQLTTSVRCFAVTSVTTVSRPAGTAVLVKYQMDSAPDSVTGKSVRDEVERYEFWRAGTEAVITLAAPVGSDNVDPWKTITDSFTWK